MNILNPKKVFVKHGIIPDELEEVGSEVLDPDYYEGRFVDGDYKEAFKEMVSRFLNMNPIPPLEFRNKAVDILGEAYLKQVGESPDGVQLNLLGNWILVDDLKNPHPDKVTNTEYPIMNKGQLRTRHKRELADEHIEKKAFPPLPKKKNTSERPSE